MRNLATRTALATLLLLLASACRATAPRPDAGGAQFDVEHYALDLTIEPAERSLHGTCRVRLWPTGAPLERVRLDLQGLDVFDVRDRSGAALAFEHARGSLTIHCARPVAAGDFAEFTIRYGGRPAKGLWFTGEEAGVPTQVFTQGECQDARWWFPCLDEPHDRATSEIAVRMPRGWKALCAGERIERREEGAHAVELWRATFPHPTYLVTLVAGDLVFVESEWDGIPLTFAAAPRLEEELRPTFAETGAILAFLSDVTGLRYPYPKYSQAAVDGFPFGGMENLSATTLIDTAVTDAPGRADHPATGLIAHEAAHQWFGDLVTCRDWSHIWLNEGFATYFAALYAGHAEGEDALRLAMDDVRAGWLRRDVGPARRPIVLGTARDPIELFFSGHVYEGGAIRLHHLRALLGDAAFLRGIRLYLGLNQGRSVVTDDLRAALEEASGRDLRAHFRAWFETSGHPVLESSWEHDAARGELRLELRQMQSERAFPCMVEVEIADAAGVRVERFETERRKEVAVFRQADAPRWVRLDPRCALPAEIVEHRTFGEWFERLAAAPDAAGRRGAARFLGGILGSTPDAAHKRTLTGVLAARLPLEPESRVRVEIALHLAALAAPELVPAFTERAREDADPRVRAIAWRALESAAPDAALAELARAELERVASYEAAAAAWGLLARLRPEDAQERAERALERPSPHGEWAARVLVEVGRLDAPWCLDVLRRFARDEAAPDAARRAAIVLLGPHAKSNPEVRRDLLAVLDSPRVRLRRDAIAALSKALTPEVRARLKEHARTATHELERHAIEDALAAAA